MAFESRQELVLDNTFSSHPLYSHRDARYQAYKVLIKQVAERLVEEDLKKIIHFCDLPSTTNSSDSLGILTLLEKKGQFSYTNVDPLKDLLRNSDRYDLVSQFVDPFSRTRHRSTYSLPPGNLGGYSTAYEAPYPTANGNVETSWPYNRGQRYRTWTPGSFSRPSSRPNLSSVTEGVFLPQPTDALPPGLTQPRAASFLHTSSHAVFQGHHHREEQEFPSSSQMSLSLSAQFPSQSLLAGNSSMHETTGMPAECSELALHHQSSGLSMLPPNNSAQSLPQPAEMSAAQFASCVSTSGKRPSPPITIPGSAPHCHNGTVSSLQQVERQRSQDRQRKVIIGQQTKALSRKKMVNCLRDHRYNEYIRVKHRMILNLRSKRNPQLGFKVWPCGLDDDKDESVTFQADVYFPTKCSAAAVRSQVRLTVTATDDQTGEEINSCSKEFSLCSLGTTVYNLIQHRALIRSKSLTIGLRVEAEVLEFHPQQISETDFNMKEVQSPMAEYQQEDGEKLLEVNPRPESRPIPETHDQ